MSKEIKKAIEELKQRRDNIDAAIKILENEICQEESQPERKRRGRPGKKSQAVRGI